MMLHIGKSLTKTCAALGVVLTTSTAFVGFSAEPAFANNGNGNGNGNGNKANNGNRGSNAERSNRGNGNGQTRERTNNGRGAIASELKSLNAAHASPTALANASPNSMPGKLNTYREGRLELLAAVDDQNVAYAEYERLAALSEDEIASQFPDGGYDAALSDATQVYSAARAVAVEAQDGAEQSLLTLTGGRTLSEAAMAELHQMLGL